MVVNRRPGASGIPKLRYGIALLLGFGVLVNYFDRVNLSVARDALHTDFGVGAAAFGILSSAYSYTYAALQLPVGVILDRYGVKTIGRIAALLWSVASFLTAVTVNFTTFFGARLLLGVGDRLLVPAARTWTRDRALRRGREARDRNRDSDHLADRREFWLARRLRLYRGVESDLLLGILGLLSKSK